MSENNLQFHLLPPTWTMTTLGTVVAYGRTNRAEPSEMTGVDWVLELEDIEKDSSRLVGRLTFADRQSKSTKNRFEAGDVLYGKLRPYLNKVLIADQPGFCTTEIVPIQAGEHLDARYLFYWLKHPAFLKYVEAESHGMNMPRLGTEAGRAAPFVLAPRAEQTRIADQLDTLLARVNACNDHLHAIPGILKRFRQAVLTAAVTGSLTEEWRGDFGAQKGERSDGLWSIPEVWRWAEAKNECGFITKGTTPSKEKMQSGSGHVPFIKVYNLGFTGALDFTVDPTYVDTQTHTVDLKRSIVLPGDVLMNIVGPPLGKVSVVPDTHAEWNINQAIARFRPGPNLRSDFLAYCLLSAGLVDHATAQSKATAGQWNLTLEICRSLPIPVPPLEEQDEIVLRLKRYMTLADEIEARCSAFRGYTQRLAPQVLAKAFRGDLVEQDPNDEPANALLARLGSQRTASSPDKKPRSPSQPRTT